VGEAHGERLAADVEVDEGLGEVGREAAARRLVLLVVREADGLGVLELEVRGGEPAEVAARATVPEAASALAAALAASA